MPFERIVGLLRDLGGLRIFSLTARCGSEPGFQIVLKPDQRKVKRDRLEVFAVREPVCAEPLLEDATDRGDERAAAGQKHAVDLVAPHTLGVEQPVDGLSDAPDVVGDPTLEIRARNLLLDIDVNRARGKNRRAAPLTASPWHRIPRDRC